MSLSKLAVVTGGAGFIGSHMVDRLLDEGFRVHVIDNLVGGRLENVAHRKDDSNLVVETRDILDLAPDDKLFAGAEYVFHFAGIGDIVPSIDKPVDYLATNVIGTVKVLECARHARVTQVGLCRVIILLRSRRRADTRRRTNPARVSLCAQ